MRRPQHDMNIFKERRQKLGQLIRGSTLVLAANPEFIRNHDVHYPFRQDSNFFYLTGFEEPESVFVFRPGQTPESVLFVRPKNPESETWDGFRYGPEATKREFQIDEVYTVDQLEEKLPKLLIESERVYYKLFSNLEFDEKMRTALLAVKKLRDRSGRGILAIEDSYPLLGELRIRKSPYEIEMLKKAAQASSEAHAEVMRATRPGMTERALHGIFLKEIMARGCAREGYGSIVATGGNATTLHYVFNDDICKDGDLLLIDAGGEYNFYTADITRTFPVNGRFTPVQKRIYQRLLDIQKQTVEMVKPGVPKNDLQTRAIEMLTDVMIEEKLLKGSRDENIRDLSYRKYYPHGIGHWLGMDVHDSGLAEVNGEPRRFEAGMVVTIEPGLYIPLNDESAPKELRGIGIRIEDNILVTPSGYENLTAAAVKEVAQLER